MWEEYEDYYEKSKLESAYDEFLNKVQEFAKEDIKNQINNIKLKEQENEAKSNKLWAWEEKLEIRQNELDRKEKELENKKSDIILEFLNKYGLDLKIGHEVWYIEDKSTSSPCPLCNGMGKIQREIDDVIYETKCINCNSSGYIKNKRYEIKKDNILQINFRFRANEKDVKENDFDCWDYTGIYLRNSGIFYKRNELFLSKEEAEKKLAELQGESK